MGSPFVNGKALDSLFDSLAGAICGKSGRPVTQARQTAEYVRHVLTRPDTSMQGKVNLLLIPRFRVRFPARAPFLCQETPRRDRTCHFTLTTITKMSAASIMKSIACLPQTRHTASIRQRFRIRTRSGTLAFTKP
jgi:hypothetical protein